MRRSLADRLRLDGVEVVGVDLVADEALGVVAGDIRWPGEWQRAAVGCDVMIHPRRWSGCRPTPRASGT